MSDIRITRYATAPLLTKYGTFTFYVYHDAIGKEHVAMVVGEIKDQEDVLCRVHSECMTSEVFYSLRCDCRSQLELALRKIQAEGRGVVLYLRQEGRGIGLGNKIKAYAEQVKNGLDTVEANVALGFPEDGREYDIAKAMLEDLGVKSIVLMTNNPTKLSKVADAGVKISERQAHISKGPKAASGYLVTKKERMGHWL